tara:strand:+ start:323 stop:637 length:315 start_codon:yes stop_codon:yes gene_type:complete
MRNTPLRAFAKKSPVKSVFDKKTSIVKDNKKSMEEYQSKQKQLTGKNKAIVDSILDTVIPSSGAEALGMVGGAGLVNKLKQGGSKLYHAAKSLKNVKSTTGGTS